MCRQTQRPLSSSTISVYDDVIPSQACALLHKLTLEHRKRSHDGSSLFCRGVAAKKLTPIETAIDQILTFLNDTSPMVEYWSRSKYMNMDAHADIDENTLKDEGVLRCPNNGHVLYMQVANSANNNNNHNDVEENKRRMGPTVVFPNRKVAWGSVTPRTSLASNPEKERGHEYIVDVENYWDDAQKQQFGYQKEESPIEEMAIVPAMNGRLLRFDGAAFHSVPKPPDRYLRSEKQELNSLTEEESDGYEDDKRGDKEEEEDKDNSNQRSVILFNTWSEGSSGPRGVMPDSIVDGAPDDYDDESDSMEEEQWNQWRDAYGTNFEKVNCNPIEKWRAVDVTHCSDDASRDVTIPLMGNPSRRGCTLTEAALNGAVHRELFYDGHKVSVVSLETGEK